jgi:hypothetical protein
MRDKVRLMYYEGSAFAFLYLLNVSPNEAHATYKASIIRRMLDVVYAESRWITDGNIRRYGLAMDLVLSKL